MAYTNKLLLIFGITFGIFLLTFNVSLAGPYTTSGDGNASPSGAFTYQVPIALPVGSSGVQPSFALVYDSRSGGNGLLGRGWDITGLSKITRCGKSVQIEGIKSGINYDVTDNYCLNGQRLLLKSGVHGEDGATYVTRQASFNKIVLKTGDAIGGAQYFEVRTKSGEIITYGSKTGGIKLSDLSTPTSFLIHAWPATRIEDRSGNYIKIEYEQSSADNLSYHPLAVKWSGNDALGLLPYNVMTLVYETRPELRRGYRSGYEIFSDKRLETIEVYTDDKLLHYYDVDYSKATALTPSQVTLIRLCKNEDDCKDPLKFEWPLWPVSSSDNADNDDNNIVVQSINSLLSLDDNTETNNAIETTFSIMGSPYYEEEEESQSAQQLLSVIPQSIISIADSDSDLELQVESSENLSKLFDIQPLQLTSSLGYESSYKHYKHEHNWWKPHHKHYKYFSRFDYRVGDFDGDGRSELMHLKEDGYKLLDYDGEGNFASSSNYTKPSGYNMEGDTGDFHSYVYNFLTGDYNGDGLSDMLHVQGDNAVNLWSGNGDGSFTQIETDLSGMRGDNAAGYRYNILGGGDFNGDGRNDLLHFTDYDEARVLISDGTGSFAATSVPIQPPPTIAVAIFGSLHGHGSGTTTCTGSGKSYSCSKTGPKICGGKGGSECTTYSSTHQHVTYKQEEGEYAKYKFVLGDYNGDGLTDIFQPVNETSVVIHFSNGDGTFTQSSNALPSADYDAKGEEEYRYLPGDFNGDGLTDLFHIKDITSQSRVWLSKGNGEFELGGVIEVDFEIEGDFEIDDQIRIIDLNGDGRTDLLVTKSETELQEWLSLGDGGFAVGAVYDVGYSLKGTDTATNDSHSAGKGIPVQFLFLPGDYDGDGSIDMVHFKDKDELRVWEGRLSPSVFHLAAVRTEGGADMEISYESLTGLESNVYTKGTVSLDYPRAHVIAPIYVVSGLLTEGGANEYYGTSYRYKDLRANLEQGLEGFRSHIARDDETALETETQINQAFPYTGLPSVVVQTDTASGVELTRIESSYIVNEISLAQNRTSYEIFLSHRKETNKDLDGTEFPTTETNNWYGANGNLVTISVTSSDGWGNLTKNTYSDNEEQWILGRLVEVEVDNWNPDEPIIQRKSKFDYSSDTGYLVSEMIEPTNTTLWIGTSYTHDTWGNIKEVRISAYGVEEHLQISTAYDSRGRYSTSSKNGLDHTGYSTRDEHLGVVIKTESANGLAATMSHDTWGRLTLETNPDGSWSSTEYGKCTSSDCPTGSSYYVKNEEIGGGIKYAYHDEWDRELLSKTQGFAADSWVIEKMDYDKWGRVIKKYSPYYEGETELSWVEVTYDKLGRPLSTKLPNDAETFYEYEGLKTTEINGKRQIKETYKDSQGNVVKVIEGGIKPGEKVLSMLDQYDNSNKRIVGDYDGDGKDELLLYEEGDETYDILDLSSGTVVEENFIAGGITFPSIAIVIGGFDWNGDYYATGNALAHINDSQFVEEKNADNKSDIVVIDSATDSIEVYEYKPMIQVNNDVAASFNSKWRKTELSLPAGYNLTEDEQDYMLSDYDLDGLLEIGHHVGGGTVNYFKEHDQNVTVTYTANESCGDMNLSDYEGTGTSIDPYLIRNICELQNIGLNLSASYRLANNIDARMTRLWNNGAGFAPIIGGWWSGFTGTLDGYNHAIYGLYINRDEHFVGVFSRILGGTVKNLALVESEHKNPTNNLYQGLLAGSLDNSGKIENIWVDGKSIGGRRAGGLVGQVSGANTEIKNVGVSVNMTQGTKRIGGLVGIGSGSFLISNAYVLGSLESLIGIIGGVFGIKSSKGNVDMVYSRASVSGQLDGGILGIGSLTDNSTGNYWDVDTSGIDTYSGNNNSHSGTKGLSSTEIECPTSANDTTCKSGSTLFEDWDEDIWYFGTSSEAPILRGTSKAYRKGWIVGDFDGDRRLDSLKNDNKVLHLTNKSVEKEISDYSSKKRIVGDYDGDGKDELLLYKKGDETYDIWDIASGTVVEENFIAGGITLPSIAIVIGGFDWNGDYYATGNALAHINDSQFLEEKNADNKSDIVVIDSATDSIEVYEYKPMIQVNNDVAASSNSKWRKTELSLPAGYNLTEDEQDYMLSDYDLDGLLEIGHHVGGGTVNYFKEHDQNVTVTYTANESCGDMNLSDYEGTGTSSDPYLIRNICELQNIGLNLSASYRLANNIDARMTRLWNNGAGFAPIGGGIGLDVIGFTGTLDGYNHAIYGLYINRDEHYVGVFRRIQGGTVKNLALVESEHNYQYPTDTFRQGLLAGSLYNSGKIENIWVDGKSIGGHYAGGLVGIVDGANTEIKNVGVSVNMTQGTASVGGLAGISFEEGSGFLLISNAYVLGSLESLGGRIGGVFGRNQTDENIDMVYSRASVSGQSEGGILGFGSLTDNSTGNYWDVDTSGIVTYSGNNNSHSGTKGLSSTEIECPTSANDTTCKSGSTLFEDWDEDIWYFGTSSEAPILRGTSKAYRKGWIVGDFDGDGRLDSLKNDDELLHLTSKTVKSVKIVKVTKALKTVVTDASIIYRYDSLGNLFETEDSKGNIIAITYDKVGNKIAMSDPDMGDWNYYYDGLSRITLQIDGKGQKSYTYYDQLSRITLSQNDSLTVVNVYDEGYKSKGKLSNTSAGNNYSQDMIYDEFGRIKNLTIGLDTDYVISVNYDTKGRLKSRHWPTGFAITMNYNPRNYLESVRGSDGITYWQSNKMDAYGNVIGYTYGNGVETTLTYDELNRLTDIVSGNGGVQNKQYEYDLLGNITKRWDGNLDQQEFFTYDSLNRLTSNDLLGISDSWTGVDEKNRQVVRYDSLGNITYKSDVGNYIYGENGAGPHAVTGVSGVKNHTYSYDGNGNQISGAGRSISYTAFNKVKELTVLKSGIETVYKYEYGSSLQRIREIRNEEETYYINPEGTGLFYEKTLKAGGLSVTHKHYIKIGGILVAVKEQIEDNDGTSYKTKYFHRDHLGSTDTLTDTYGDVSQRNSYDAWGKRRHVEVQDNGSVEDIDGSIVSAMTRRGFTEHEHIDEAGLINMNGRLYDPLLGRFIQADIIIQAPENTQNYNRYSYVLNNPLSYTDPTGHFVEWIIAAIVFLGASTAVATFLTYALIVISVAALVTGNPILTAIAGIGWTLIIPGAASLFEAAALGFASGFVGSGGDVSAGITGAVSAALFFGVGQAFMPKGTGPLYQQTNALAQYAGGPLQWAAHGVVGGIATKMQGGKFGHGFASSAFTKFAGTSGLIPGNVGELSARRLIGHAVVGGTVSSLSGGKFANGAQNGAYGYLFNELAP